MKPNIQIQEKDNLIYQVNIEGDFTLNSIEEVKQDLNPTVNQCNGIEIVLQNISNLDVSAIQLLISIRKEMELKHKTFDLKMEIPELLQTMLERSGLMKSGIIV